MLLLVHSEVFMSVSLHALLLVIEHFPLHAHELCHSICLEVVQQMLQLILEVLRILVHNLWQHIMLTDLSLLSLFIGGNLGLQF